MTLSRRALTLGAAISAAPFNAFAQDDTHPDFPFAATYRKDGRLLVFIAATHTVSPTSRTHDLVNRAFQQHRFGAAIVEGVPTSFGPSPEQVRASLDRPSPPGAASWTMGESGLTARRAIAANIPFIGGEPDQAQLNLTLVAEGHAPDDILATLLLRRVPQMLRSGQVRSVGDPRLADEFERMLETDRRHFTPAAEFTLDNFYAWYRAQYGQDFVVELDIDQRVNINAGTRYGILQRRMLALRDEHLLRLITAQLDSTRAVIAVYGGAHYTSLQAALRTLLGPPLFA